MNATEVVVFAGLAALIILSQFGRHTLTARRLLAPVLGAGYVAWHYLQSVPTAGGDLDFEIALALAGLVLGIGAACLMRVERDVTTGRIVTVAGPSYAALWVIVFGGRLAFAWAATHIWQHQVAQFAIQHVITSAAAWTAAFIFMALSMVLARTLIVGGRAVMLAGPLSLRTVTR